VDKAATPGGRFALVLWASNEAFDRLVARVTGVGASSSTRVPGHAVRTCSGRPRSNMRFSTSAAMATSVSCRPSVWKRSASPITRLKRAMSASHQGAPVVPGRPLPSHAGAFRNGPQMAIAPRLCHVEHRRVGRNSVVLGSQAVTPRVGQRSPSAKSEGPRPGAPIVRSGRPSARRAEVPADGAVRRQEALRLPRLPGRLEPLRLPLPAPHRPMRRRERLFSYRPTRCATRGITSRRAAPLQPGGEGAAELAHQRRTVSCETSTPRSVRVSSTSRRLSAKV